MQQQHYDQQTLWYLQTKSRCRCKRLVVYLISDVPNYQCTISCKYFNFYIEMRQSHVAACPNDMPKFFILATETFIATPMLFGYTCEILSGDRVSGVLAFLTTFSRWKRTCTAMLDICLKN